MTRTLVSFVVVFAVASAAHAQDAAPPPEAAAPAAEPASSEPAPAEEPAAAPAEPPPPDSAEAKDVLAFADHLFRDGDWYRAITEYRRYLYLVKGYGEDGPRAAMAIGEALARGEQWDAAGRQLDGIAQRAGTPDLRQQALFGAARSYLLDGRPELAKPRFRLLVEDGAVGTDLKREAQWLLAWGHFDAGELTLAKGYFDVLASTVGSHTDDAKGASAAVDEHANLDLKDPLLAGLLSTIPGLGHIYLGQWGTGITSMVWNGVFIVAAAAAWISGDWAVAAVLTLLELGWYSGGVFGAIAGAYRHNRDTVRNWRDDVLLRYGQSRELPDSGAVESFPPGSMLRFTGTFGP